MFSCCVFFRVVFAWCSYLFVFICGAASSHHASTISQVQERCIIVLSGYDLDHHVIGLASVSAVQCGLTFSWDEHWKV